MIDLKADKLFDTVIKANKVFALLQGVSELYVPSSWSTEDVVALMTQVPSLTQGTRVVLHTPSASSSSAAAEASAATATLPGVATAASSTPLIATAESSTATTVAAAVVSTSVTIAPGMLQLEGRVPMDLIAVILLTRAEDKMTLTGKSTITEPSVPSIRSHVSIYTM